MSATETVFTPGGWVAFTAADLWALVDLPVDDPQVARLWEAIAVGRPLLALVDLLASNGVEAAPGFALVARNGDRLRYVVRHPAHLSGDSADGSWSVAASDALTWVDGVTGDPTRQSEGRIVLSSDGSEPLAGLPVVGGVTQARSLAVAARAAVSAGGVLLQEPEPALEPSPEPAPASEPAPAPAPEPEPEEPRRGDPARYVQLIDGSTADRDKLLESLRQTQQEAARSSEPDPEPANPPEERSVPRHETAFWDPEAPPSTPAPSPTPPAGRLPVSPGLVDGVPWATGTSDAAPPGAPQPPASGAGRTDQSLSTTVGRDALLQAMAAERSTYPTVPAVQCPRGHLTPPGSAACRVCAARVTPQEPVDVPRPTLGTLVLSTGTVVPLDKGVLIGRAPETDEPAATRPNMVRLIESDEISRMHASVSLDGWRVLLRDLGSANGTKVTRPGHAQESLHPNVDCEITPGTLVSIADVVTFTYRVEVTP